MDNQPRRRAVKAPAAPVGSSMKTTALDENESSTSRTAIRRRGLGLNDLPGEIRNQIFLACKSYCVNITAPRRRTGIDAMVNSDTTFAEGFAGIYYTENLFLLDARVNFSCHGFKALRGLSALHALKLWLAQFDRRHVGMIQHLCFNMIAFSARVHVPINRRENVNRGVPKAGR